MKVFKKYKLFRINMKDGKLYLLSKEQRYHIKKSK